MATIILPYGEYEPHHKVKNLVKLGASSKEALEKIISKKKKENWLMITDDEGNQLIHTPSTQGGNYTCEMVYVKLIQDFSSGMYWWVGFLK